jgi:MGT family glycosyltransferase
VATIGIVHIGLAGHVAAGTRLGAVLTGQGHRVHAWAPESYRPSIEASCAVLHPFDPVPRAAITGGVSGFMATLAVATEAHVEGLAAELIDVDVDLIVHDDHAPWGWVAAEFLGLPRIVSATLFPGRRGQRAGDLPSRTLVPSPQRQADLARAKVSRQAVLAKWGVDTGDPRPGATPTVVPTVSYTTSEIAGFGDLAPGWCFVGPLLAPGPPPRRRAGRPLVYASLGTFFNYTADVYDAIVEGLGDEPVDVVISTGGPPPPVDMLAPLPSNVQFRGFVPTRELLAESSLMVTHCGNNSTHEALMAGVPMLCLPQALDQFAAAERVQQLGAGRIAAATPKAIGETAQRLLTDPAPRRRAAELGRHLASYDGEARVARVLAGALGRRSPMA